MGNCCIFSASLIPIICTFMTHNLALCHKLLIINHKIQCCSLAGNISNYFCFSSFKTEWVEIKLSQNRWCPFVQTWRSQFQKKKKRQQNSPLSTGQHHVHPCCMQLLPLKWWLLLFHSILGGAESALLTSVPSLLSDRSMSRDHLGCSEF